MSEEASFVEYPEISTVTDVSSTRSDPVWLPESVQNMSGGGPRLHFSVVGEPNSGEVLEVQLVSLKSLHL